MGVQNGTFEPEEIKRRKALAYLLGIGEAEAGDTSLNGRLSIIAKLKAARRTEIARGQAGSWLYDVNRHLNICASLRREYEALEEMLANDLESAAPSNAAIARRGFGEKRMSRGAGGL
ncbi:hypothetical protein Rvan_1624 [Rhodomicrobium vannielii ATCC 17100]|uniref:Uncharacterized protein n=1 Tax=Rhodomicrobium vannielii (strain ATCC 17100 / DSM 162 / LMG 4299 / NCIMB 10020 / ATH 3.1.1) TaxID=648757 RepID=E3I8G6_RHOVT|nr:hypothetical protein [Rhodomicrobium vannielii]ADP70875.1 hypothetical protein Rvan_1624 [Rhodomicrobium vannielii ATCC 17100]